MNDLAKNLLLWVIVAVVLMVVFQGFTPRGGAAGGNEVLYSEEALAPVLALGPEVVVLGTGDAQVFPPARVMAACLSRGVGLEVMANAAAARTFHVLAGEHRKVVVAMILG